MYVSLNGRHAPMVYCLLPSKSQASYERAFSLVEEKVRSNLQKDLLPSVVLSDFEQAIMQAAKSVFPAVTIKGCYFISVRHFSTKCRAWGCRWSINKMGN